MLGKTFLLLAMATAAAATETGKTYTVMAKEAAAAFDEVIVSFSDLGPDHCYTNTSAAKLDIEELKSKFESYRMARLKVNRTALARVDKKELMDTFKGRQKAFAATKRDLRTKKRAAKLGGKRCFWTRNPTPPPTQPPTEPPTLPPSSSPTQAEVVTHTGDFKIKYSDDCAAKTKLLQTFTYITGGLFLDESKCTSLELNLLKGIGGYLRVEYTTLRTFNANQLQSIGGELLVWGNNQLRTLGLGSVNQIGKNGDQRLDISNNRLDACSSALYLACTSTTPVQGKKCYVSDCECEVDGVGCE